MGGRDTYLVLWWFCDFLFGSDSLPKNMDWNLAGCVDMFHCGRKTSDDLSTTKVFLK